MLQLNPTIPVETPKGKGYALFVIDYSSEHHIIWIVALDATREVWGFSNPEIKVQSNYTMRKENNANRAYEESGND